MGCAEPAGVPQPVRVTDARERRARLRVALSSILPLVSGSGLRPSVLLDLGEMAARSGDGGFGAAQLVLGPSEAFSTQLDRLFGRGRLQSREHRFPLVGPHLAFIGLRLTLIGRRLTSISHRVALSGGRVAFIGCPLAISDDRSLHRDAGLQHLQRDLSGIGGSLTRRDGRLADLRLRLTSLGPPAQLALVRLRWLHDSQGHPSGGGCRAKPQPSTRTSPTCFIDGRLVPGEARSRCPACRSHIGCPRFRVWLSRGLRGPGTAGWERLKRGLLGSK